MPPAFQRREHHEQIGDAIGFVFVIVTRWLHPGFGGDRRARVDDRLHFEVSSRHTSEALRIVRSLIDFRTSSMVATNAALASGRSPIAACDTDENVFNVRPIVLSLARSTMCSSTTFSSSRRRLHLAKPAGAGERVSAISFASATPSKIRGRAEFELYLRARTASNPSSTNWRLVRSTVAMLVSNAAAIRLSLQPSPASDMSAFQQDARLRRLVGGTLAFADQLVEPIAFLRVEPDHVFLDGNLFPGHESPPSLPCRDRSSEIPVMINDRETRKEINPKAVPGLFESGGIPSRLGMVFAH